jgi:indole-3-glycerol phosphate synthase
MRFSQAISEGDGISLIVEIADVDAARAAQAQGAEALVVRRPVDSIRSAVEVPVLWCAAGDPRDALEGGADAWLLRLTDAADDGTPLARRHAEAIELGLDAVVEVHAEDELELALEQIDPQIFLLSVHTDDAAEALQRSLELLPDVPAGKLAVAEVHVTSRDQVDELERAGVDAVIVGARSVAELVGGIAPEV